MEACFISKHNQIAFERMYFIQKFCNENSGLSEFDKKRFNHMLDKLISIEEMDAVSRVEITKSLDSDEIEKFLKYHKKFNLEYYFLKELEACSVNQKAALKDFIDTRISTYDDSFWKLIERIDKLTATSDFLVKRNNNTQTIIANIFLSKHSQPSEFEEARAITELNKKEYAASKPGAILLAFTYQDESMDSLESYCYALETAFVEDAIHVIKSSLENAIQPLIQHYLDTFKVYF